MNLAVFSGSLFLAGAFSSVLFRRRLAQARAASCLFAGLGSVLSLLDCLRFLSTGTVSTLELGGPAALGGFRFGLTPFSAVFAGLISALGAVCSLYAAGYAEEYDRRAGELGFFYNLFLLGMTWVPAARNVFSFLFCWEVMTLASFFLVALDREREEARTASVLYFAMSQAGAVFLLAMFFLLHRSTGSWDFSSFEALGPSLGAPEKDLLFLLALVGFGTKAGIIPFHIWLPYAHPEAPGHVSALMSGVMIKTGIYGFLLCAFSFLGGGPAWWGALVLSTAALSSVLGVLYALMEHDIKRLLAYHSVENIGIILMGVGSAMLFASFGHPRLAATALTAGLFHTVNHALFKGLLFLGAGSVSKSLHTRDLEEMGGLIKPMPATAACFLVGSMAISALPPLNGFASEWLTFQSLLSGFQLPTTGTRVLCLLSAAALALTGGLAAACFVKAFGIAFLALPRSAHAREAREASLAERSGMAALAGACVLLGLWPEQATRWLGPGVESLLAGAAASASAAAPSAAGGRAAYGSIVPSALLALLAASALASWCLVRALGGSARVRLSSTWGCGLRELTPRMEYTATAFSKPFRMLFASLYRPVRETRIDSVANPYFPRRIHHSSAITHLIQEKLYRPSLGVLLGLSHSVRRLQAGSVNLYLAYLSATLTVLLLLCVWGLP